MVISCATNKTRSGFSNLLKKVVNAHFVDFVLQWILQKSQFCCQKSNNFYGHINPLLCLPQLVPMWTVNSLFGNKSASSLKRRRRRKKKKKTSSKLWLLPPTNELHQIKQQTVNEAGCRLKEELRRKRNFWQHYLSISWLFYSAIRCLPITTLNFFASLDFPL